LALSPEFKVTEWVNLAISLSVGFGFRMLAIRYYWGMPKFDYQHGGHGNQDSQAH